MSFNNSSHNIFCNEDGTIVYYVSFINIRTGNPIIYKSINSSTSFSQITCYDITQSNEIIINFFCTIS